MTITILFLGPARDYAGAEEAHLTLGDGATVAQARVALADAFPTLSAALPAVRFAVNETFVDDDAALADGDELALIPPVSGG